MTNENQSNNSPHPSPFSLVRTCEEAGELSVPPACLLNTVSTSRGLQVELQKENILVLVNFLSLGITFHWTPAPHLLVIQVP